ncbi:MAG TPA: NADH-quinone oxidoreductase subunit J [Mycobacteriales bacterium]
MAAHLMTAHVLAAQVMTHTRASESAVFWIVATLSILGALAVVFSKNAVHAALALAGVMVCLAIFYGMQDAPFLAVVQIVVYAGAVMSLFLFVVMLIGVDSSDSLVETIRGQRLASAAFGLAFIALMVGVIGHAITHATAVGLGAANAGGNVQALARLIFTTYFWPFEVISALLIIAALGAMVLAHRERIVPRPTQAELMRARFRGDHLWTPHSGPGVFAAGDAVDRPALLPTGAPDAESVYDEVTGYRSGDDPRETTP